MSGGTGIVGIVGGMGPMATWDLAGKITEETHAASDQEHVRVLVDSNTNIADRTAAIVGGGPSPVDEMRNSARLLERAGAAVLAMPCNTAHCFHGQVQDSVSIPLLHMPRLTAAELGGRGVARAAVLATDGALEAGIYASALEECSIRPVYPNAENQAIVMDMIYGHVKAGRLDFSRLPVERVLADVKEQGAEVLVLGCTELPVAFAALGRIEGTIDPTRVLARAAVAAVGAPLRRRNADRA